MSLACNIHFLDVICFLYKFTQVGTEQGKIFWEAYPDLWTRLDDTIEKLHVFVSSKYAGIVVWEEQDEHKPTLHFTVYDIWTVQMVTQESHHFTTRRNIYHSVEFAPVTQRCDCGSFWARQSSGPPIRVPDLPRRKHPAIIAPTGKVLKLERKVLLPSDSGLNCDRLSSLQLLSERFLVFHSTNVMGFERKLEVYEIKEDAAENGDDEKENLAELTRHVVLGRVEHLGKNR